MRQAAAALGLIWLAGCAGPPPAGTPQVPPSASQAAVDDASLTRRIQAAFANEPMLQGAAITVQTSKGKVQLSGSVASRAAARAAIKLALRVQGVQSVGESLRVK